MGAGRTQSAERNLRLSRARGAPGEAEAALRDATITTVLTVTETCVGSVCSRTTEERVVLSFVGDEVWAALEIAAREAGVAVGLLLETYARTGLSLAGYELAAEVAA